MSDMHRSTSDDQGHAPEGWLLPVVRFVIRHSDALSLVGLVWGTREQVQSVVRAVGREAQYAETRGKGIDSHVIVNFFIAVLLLIARSLDACPAAVGSGVVWAAIRVGRIAVATADLAFFDPQRAGSGGHRVASAPRMILLTAINYCELILCFALLYTGHLHQDGRVNSGVLNALYFSAVTQTTTGFGDLVPDPSCRWLVIVHGLIAQALVVVVISRLVGLLPLASGGLTGLAGIDRGVLQDTPLCEPKLAGLPRATAVTPEQETAYRKFIDDRIQMSGLLVLQPVLFVSLGVYNLALVIEGRSGASVWAVVGAAVGLLVGLWQAKRQRKQFETERCAVPCDGAGQHRS